MRNIFTVLLFLLCQLVKAGFPIHHYSSPDESWDFLQLIKDYRSKKVREVKISGYNYTSLKYIVSQYDSAENSITSIEYYKKRFSSSKVVPLYKRVETKAIKSLDLITFSEYFLKNESFITEESIEFKDTILLCCRRNESSPYRRANKFWKGIYIVDTIQNSVINLKTRSWPDNYIRRYDKEGRLIWNETYNDVDSFAEIQINDSITEEIWFSNYLLHKPGLHPGSKRIFQNGLLIKSIWFDDLNKIYKEIHYEYNSQNQLIKKYGVHPNSNNPTMQIFNPNITYTYNSKGLIQTSNTCYKLKGELKSETLEFEYTYH